jgi:trimethylamine corrinoid protein
MSQETFQAMRQSIIDGAAITSAELARQAITLGIDPITAIEQGYVPGVDHVGEQFAQRKMFFPDLVMAGEAMKAALTVLEPELERRGETRHTLGTVVLGTVKGDIHEIGKSLVSIMLTAAGFKVHDLGVDVPYEKFAARAKEVGADIIGMSALLTTTMQGQRKVIESLERDGLRPQVKVMVGGAPVTRQWAKEIGADGYGANAIEAVATAKALMELRTAVLDAGAAE